MEVHVQVAVDVRQREPGRDEGVELRLDLAPQLRAPGASERDAQA